MRCTIEQYGISLAKVIASRSEDPYAKVGAVGFDANNRIVAAGYNGLARGKTLTPEQWANRDYRLKFILHAEQNLCANFKFGEVHTVYTTLSPCLSCLKLLDAHGVQNVVYLHKYDREDCSELEKHVNLKIQQFVDDKFFPISATVNLDTTQAFPKSFLSEDYWDRFGDS